MTLAFVALISIHNVQMPCCHTSNGLLAIHNFLASGGQGPHTLHREDFNFL
jgi:hypothetical protein